MTSHLKFAGLSDFTFMIMQIGPELTDLFWLVSDADLEAFGAAQSSYWRLRHHALHRARRDAAASPNAKLPLTEPDHCSALVKFDNATGELYAAQVCVVVRCEVSAICSSMTYLQATWGLFEMMIRSKSSRRSPRALLYTLYVILQ